MTNNNAGISDGVTAHMVRGATPARDAAGQAIYDVLAAAAAPPVTHSRSAIATNILEALEALGWTPPKDTP